MDRERWIIADTHVSCGFFFMQHRIQEPCRRQETALIVIYFRYRKVKAVIAPERPSRQKVEHPLQYFRPIA